MNCQKTKRRKIPNPVPLEDRAALTINDAAGVLSLSRGTIYKMLAEKKLTSVVLGGRRLVTSASVRNLLKAPFIEPTRRSGQCSRLGEGF